ncbi:MAG: hypothetical protein K9J12_09250 [Melioribacteraceae bacterium]|nr:hypothetical protein [Melioribacteraceae bacterium]MCF8265888.1 hypothetical protein [Melioribacteraceae bacterium]MCF8413437.1 hypothetical protein [Melioribacteraceae bacterium]MCF8432671.1 hypothetical protein [Melioribacteraceae bacterium]
MENFRLKLDRNTPKHYKYSKYIYLLLGIIYTILGIMQYEEAELFSKFYLLIGPALIVTSFFTKRFEKQYGIEITEHNIKTYFNFFDKVEVNWNDVDSIKVLITSVQLKLKSGKTETISLSNFGYDDLKNSKSAFEKFAISKNVKLDH